MAERVVASAHGYYVFECPAEAGRIYYEVRKGMSCIKRCNALSEAERYLKRCYEREQNNFS